MDQDRAALITRLEQEIKDYSVFGDDYERLHLVPLLREAAAAMAGREVMERRAGLMQRLAGPTPEGRETLRTAKIYAVITEMRRKVGKPDDRDAKSVWSWRLDEWADTLAAITGDTEEKP
jgi:hypothetical protein